MVVFVFFLSIPGNVWFDLKTDPGIDPMIRERSFDLPIVVGMETLPESYVL